MSLIGHNGGPTLAPGRSWRKHCWQRARADLLPHLPLEVVRMRVRRAAEIGLDYKTYAGFRASTGHDIVALLFSTNALRMLRPGDILPEPRAVKLRATRDLAHLVAAHPPLAPLAVRAVLSDAGIALAGCHPAPSVAHSWAEIRSGVRALLAERRLPGDRVLLIGDTCFEQEWTGAGGLAGYLTAPRYFPEAIA